MTVKELINILQKFPQDAGVRGFYDSGDRIEILSVWESGEGVVCMGEHGYHGSGPYGRPFWIAGTEYSHWKTPELKESLAMQANKQTEPA